MLLNVFENFNQLDSCKNFFSPRSAWQAALKKIVVKLEQLTDIDMYEINIS